MAGIKKSRQGLIEKSNPIYVGLFHTYEIVWLENLYQEYIELYD